MSVQSQINRLTDAKSDIKLAIESKGVQVPESSKINEYYSYISKIKEKDYINVFLPFDSWELNGGVYEQTVLNSSVDSTWMFGKPVAVSESESIEIYDAVSLISSATTSTGSIKFTCEDEKPTVDLNIMLRKAFQVTLSPNSWVESNGYYSQTVSVDGVSSSFYFDLPDFFDSEPEINKSNFVSIESGTNSIKFVCDKKNEIFEILVILYQI